MNNHPTAQWGIWCQNSFGDAAWMRDREGRFKLFPTRADAQAHKGEITDRQSAWSRVSYQVRPYDHE